MGRINQRHAMAVRCYHQEFLLPGHQQRAIQCVAALQRRNFQATPFGKHQVLILLFSLALLGVSGLVLSFVYRCWDTAATLLVGLMGIQHCV